ncbi:hypothetical protein J2X32_004211, partial [Rheinheimera pacifica]|uniref:condensation domain-containing protein n=1 Tax=Rheinheimera pacifica TaxID=173990 RepID=UPI0028580AA3
MVSAAQLVQRLNACGISITAEQGQLKTKAAKGKLTEELATQIRQCKQELLTFLSNVNNVEQAPQVTAGIQHQELPLSFAQQRLWLLDQIDGGSAHYNMPFTLRLSGTLDRAALTTALNGIVMRHAVLRTVYLQKDDGAVTQHVMPEAAVTLIWQDLSNEAQEQVNLRFDELQQAEAMRPFDLSRDVMLRATVLSVSAHEHVLL